MAKSFLENFQKIGRALRNPESEFEKLRKPPQHSMPTPTEPGEAPGPVGNLNRWVQEVQ